MIECLKCWPTFYSHKCFGHLCLEDFWIVIYKTTIYGFLLFFFVADDKEEPRILGLAMVPGKHIVSIEVDVE